MKRVIAHNIFTLFIGLFINILQKHFKLNDYSVFDRHKVLLCHPRTPIFFPLARYDKEGENYDA